MRSLVPWILVLVHHFEFRCAALDSLFFSSEDLDELGEFSASSSSCVSSSTSSASTSSAKHESSKSTGSQHVPNLPPPTRSSPASKPKTPPASTRASASSSSRPPNVVFIVADQLRFDALGFVQARMQRYQGKLHVRTPHIDQLARQGTNFETTYCVAPSCGPSRAGFKTGCALQRTGVLDNKCFSNKISNRMEIISDRIDRMVSFEQVLVEQKGYEAETFGKWHSPFRLYYDRNATTKNHKGIPRVIEYNVYDNNDRPAFETIMNVDQFYPHDVKLKAAREGYVPVFKNGMQLNSFSGLPYTPIRLDSRYGSPTNTPLSRSQGFKRYQMSDINVCGVEAVANYSATAIIGDMAVKALQRRMSNFKDRPFIISVHFNAPHPPMVASPQYFPYYYSNRTNLFISPSITDDMSNSAYKFSNTRRLIPILGDKYPYDDPSRIAELTSSYYAMIEEIDAWVGKIMNVVDRYQNKAGPTLLIFTSDHGEMMGAHGMLNKAVMLEEATRVPLIMRLPGKIPANRVVHDYVSQMDLHATILDYCQASKFDQSTGKSLRRFVENTSTNSLYDDSAVVVELDERFPVKKDEFSKGLGQDPNFMVRKGPYKLILTKLAKSTTLDMMYNVFSDPYEVTNLLGDNGDSASDETIGKAEHLKALLIEWMLRMDGPYRVYSDPKYNLGEGAGDVQEIKKRRTWRAVPFWQSDRVLSFGPAVRTSRGTRVRSEFLYVGRTMDSPQPLLITGIAVRGTHGRFFSVGTKNATIAGTGYVRIRVTMALPDNIKASDVSAWVIFNATSTGIRRTPITLV